MRWGSIFLLGMVVGAVFADATYPDRHAPKGCTTDSECFVQCQRDKGRPCTEDEVFGPPYTMGERE